MSMSWPLPRRLGSAFLLAFVLLTTVLAFGQGAKISASVKSKAAAKSAKPSAKKSKTGHTKHALSNEQRERIAEKMAESKRAHDHPAEAEKFYLSRRLAPGQRHLPVEKYLAARERMRSMPRYDSGMRRLLTPDEH